MSITLYNSVAIVIPKTSLPITDSDMKVDIYYAAIDYSAPVTITELSTKLINVKGQMHVRGEATAQLPKQQYTIKLDKEPDQGNFLGMPNKGKHWVFNDCGAVDVTLIRNPFTFSLQKKMGQYAPAYTYFELFICDPNTDIADLSSIFKNHYHGAYLNFDKIRFEKSRIDLPYHKKKITDDYAIIQLNQKSSKYFQFPVNPPLTSNVEIYEPKIKDLTKDLETNFTTWYYDGANGGWVGNFANAFNNYILQKKSIPGTLFTDIQNTTDYKSFATYFLINEIAKDPDGYHKSTFMVKNKLVVEAGPFWDKNKSFGNVATLGATDPYVKPDGWLFSISGQAPIWWSVLIKDPAFCKEIWNQWNTYLSPNTGSLNNGNNQNTPWVTDFIDTQYLYLFNNTKMQERDATRWPSANNTAIDYPVQVTQFKFYIISRLTWMSQNIKTMLEDASGVKLTSPIKSGSVGLIS